MYGEQEQKTGTDISHVIFFNFFLTNSALYVNSQFCEYVLENVIVQ